MPIESLHSCPICNSPRLSALPVPRTWIHETALAPVKGAVGLSRCLECSFNFVNPRPGAEHLDAFYSGKEYVCHRPTHAHGVSKNAEFIIDYISKFQPRRGIRFLDYGCGGGWLLRSAIARGWDGEGYDIGGEALETTRQQGMTVTDDFDALPRGVFDVVILNKVFEHVADHEETLAQLKTLLAPGGLLVLVVPNIGSLRARLSAPLMVERFRFDERHRAFPIHLSYFTADTLSRLLERNGYDVRASNTFGIGLDELIAPEESSHEPYAPSRPRTERTGRGSPVKSVLKGLVKKAFMPAFSAAKLGENLFVVAAPTFQARA